MHSYGSIIDNYSMMMYNYGSARCKCNRERRVAERYISHVTVRYVTERYISVCNSELHESAIFDL